MSSMENIKHDMGKVNPARFNKHNENRNIIHFQQPSMFQPLKGHHQCVINILAQPLNVFTVLLCYVNKFTININ